MNTTGSHGRGTDAILDVDVDERPFCKHGPTLLFERFLKDGTSKQFFACSACRDRKDCSFFQWKDDKITDGKKMLQKEIKKTISKRKRCKQLGEGDLWCFTCQLGITGLQLDAHNNHVTQLLSSQDLSKPTSLLNPKANKTFNAQYFFDAETLKFLLTTIKRLQYKNVICIGCPTLFESIQATGDENLSAILLDIDNRFECFYSNNHFQQYNMFNNFFFHETQGRKMLKEFLTTAKPHEVLIIADPPFGGLMNVLASTFQSFWNLLGDAMLATLLIFPYFLQKQVEENLTNFQMLDYKVSYENHSKYSNDVAPHGSPIRIFTNIPAERIQLPQDGYRFCKLCQRYVYKENWHCKICKFCTSKDGRTYVHCTQCKNCVKPGRVHCDKCNRCQLKEHTCTITGNVGCHICGELDHKRRDCPKKKELKKEKAPKRQAKSRKLSGGKKKKV